MTVTDERADAAEIGRSRRRKEDARLITGRTMWTDNLTLPGLLHVAILRSPMAHARISGVDLSQALEMPNVIAAFSGADLAESQGSLPCAWPVTAGDGPSRPPADRRHRGPAHRRGRRGGHRPRPGQRPGRAGGDRDRLRAAAGRAGHGGRARRRRRPGARRQGHQPELQLGLRLGRGRHRRCDRRGAGRRRGGDRAAVQPAAADTGVHGAAQRRGGPDVGRDHDVVGDADPAHPAADAGARPASPSTRSG